MSINERNPRKSEGHDGSSGSRIDEKPATIVLTIGAVIDAQHHSWSDDNTVLNIYLDGVSRGIDAHVPREHVKAILRSDAAEKEVAGL